MLQLNVITMATKTIVARIEVPEGYELSAVVVKKFIPTMKRLGPKDGGWHEQHTKFKIIEQPADDEAKNTLMCTLLNWAHFLDEGIFDRKKLATEIRSMANTFEPAEGVVAPVAGLPIEQEPKYTINGTHIINRMSGEVIPHDEPVMIFRARDKNAAPMIAFYKKLCLVKEHAAVVHDRLHHFIEFMHAYPERMKEPDTAPINHSSDVGK